MAIYRHGHNLIFQILQTDQISDEIELKFLEKEALENGVYKWPKRSDESWEALSNILAVFAQPEIVPGRGLYLKFDTDQIQKCKSIL